MRTAEEFKNEVYSRSNRQTRKRRTRFKLALSGTAVVAMALVIVILGNFMGGTANIVTIQAADLMEGIEKQSVAGKDRDDTFIDSQMRFYTQLFKESVRASEEKNVLISPTSVMLALAMATNGAKGATRTELENVLGGGISIVELNEYLYTYVNGLAAEEGNKLQISNSIWLRDDIEVEKDFLQTNANYYGASAYKGPFDESLVSDVNKWVNHSTDGLIDKIMDEVGESDCAYLINAVLFDAKWQELYTSSDISFGKFVGYHREKQSAEFMASSESIYIDDGRATGFIKPYKGGDYSFVGLLPNEGVDILEYIDEFTYKDTMASAKKDTVLVTMPKFTYEYDLEMSDILKVMGIEKAFNSEADFTGLGYSPYGNIVMSKVNHKTFITVDDSGTKAGAVTKVDMTDECGPLESEKNVRLDRPFVYMIIDNETNLPIFMGAVMDIQ